VLGIFHLKYRPVWDSSFRPKVGKQKYTQVNKDERGLLEGK